MTTTFSDALFLGIASAAGIASGWWLKYFNVQRLADETDAARAEESKLEKAKTKDMMQQLQTLASSVAAQVGEHNSRVQEINSELSTTSDGQGAVSDALAKLMEANAKMQAQLESAEQKLEQKSRELESQVTEARTDALTQINNRRAFDEEMKKCLAKYQSNGRPSSVMMMDVDFFKKFNDTHGHKAGDEVLRYVARTVQAAIAQSEIVCRYGGEEFAVIFPGSTLTAARAGAERARAAIGAATIEYEGKSLRVNASAGLAEFMAGENVEAVLKRADDALYVSKKAGRDCGHYHDGKDYIPFVPRPKVEPPPPVAPKPEAKVAPPAPKPAPPPAPEPVEDVHDPVTGLSNRMSFYDDLNRRVAEWKRGGTSLSIVLMKIDGLSEIVRECGSEAEPLLLKAAGQFLKATMRDMDHVSRYESDTFSMLLPTARLQNAATISERLRRAVLRCKLPLGSRQLSFTVSFGVAEAIQGDSANRVLQRSAMALNAASSSGGNTTYVHNGEKCFSVKQATTPADPAPA